MTRKPPDDLKEVMGEETRRGRRPINPEVQRKRREKLAELRKLLELGTEAEFTKAVRAFGLREGSREFLEALEIWREYRS